MKTDHFEVRYGFDTAWLDRAIKIYNKTEMKRNNPEKVGRAFSNSQVVASVWVNVLVDFARHYLPGLV